MPDTDHFNFQSGSWSRDARSGDTATLVIAGGLGTHPGICPVD